MLNESGKEQISLFELPEPAQRDEKPAGLNEPKMEKHSHPVARQPANVETKPAVTERPVPPQQPLKPAGLRIKSPSRAKIAGTAVAPVPEGDVRLTANIRQDLHLKLKIAAATRRTTIGELIEALVEKYL